MFNIDVDLVFNKVELNTQDIVPAMSCRTNHYEEVVVEGSGYNTTAVSTNKRRMIIMFSLIQSIGH